MGKIIAAGKGARIVNLSSMGYFLGELPFDDINWDNGKTYSPWHAYAGSKTANILFNFGLADKLKGKGVTSIVVHPGCKSLKHRNSVRDTNCPVFLMKWSSKANSMNMLTQHFTRRAGRSQRQGTGVGLLSLIIVDGYMLMNIIGVPMDMEGDEKTLEQGCSTPLVAALDPKFEGTKFIQEDKAEVTHADSFDM